MPFARIQDGVVAEIFAPPSGVNLEDCFTPELATQFQSCGKDVRQGWVYADGKFAAPPPPEPPVQPVPSEVERYQALLALRTAGITRAVIEAAIAAIEDADRRDVMEIRYGQPRWARDSEFIAWGESTFGLTDKQVDDLFRLAPTL